MRNKNKSNLPFYISLALIAILGAAFISLSAQKGAEKEETPLAPIENLIIEDEISFAESSSPESRIYKIQTEKSPKFLDSKIEPYDVHVGDTQNMTLIIEDANEVKSVIAEIKHDLGSDEVRLKLVKSDGKKSVWFGQWEVKNTHSATYHTTFTAIDKSGNNNSITLAWTDPCTVPISGTWTVDGNCIMSGVNGVEEGDIIVPADFTITIDTSATFVFNPTRKIMLSGGSIAIAPESSIKKTKLWALDADNDHFAGTTNLVASDSSPGASYVRKSTLNAVSADCNDADISKWRLGYFDSDGDGYGAGSQVCVGNDIKYVDNSQDCYDSSFIVNPPQTNYYTTNRGDGSFDYNCDGTASKNPALDCYWGRTNANDAGCSIGLTHAGYCDRDVCAAITLPSCGQSATWLSVLPSDGCYYLYEDPESSLYSYS